MIAPFSATWRRAGATLGIGVEVTSVLAKQGAQIVIPARNLKAFEAIKSKIQSETPAAKIIILKMDLSSLSSVRSFVVQFMSLELPLNILM